MGGWVLKMKLMLTQLSTKLELKLKLSLAIKFSCIDVIICSSVSIHFYVSAYEKRKAKVDS